MNQPSEIAKIARESFLTQEKPALVGQSKKNLVIGIPNEQSNFEKRVPLKPASVANLIGYGHEVVVESGAGSKAFFSDDQYSEAGAKISYNSKEAFEADLVIKVEPPTLKEIEYLQKGSTLISTFQTAQQNAAYLEAIGKKKIIAIGYEFIRDKVGGLPLM